MGAITAQNKEEILRGFAPDELLETGTDQKAIPKLAKNGDVVSKIEGILPILPTHHAFHLADSTLIDFIEPKSVHLVLTSPPYWTLKKYNSHERQLGLVDDYNDFLSELNKVWNRCYDALIPGGRLIVVVGDVCLSRRKNKGRHTVVPLHASIQEQCREIGYDNLAPIIWYKIANASLEASGNSSFLGKPYEPNSIIKNDIEFILMERKPGGYRSPGRLERCFSVISAEKHKEWFQQIWSGVTGASTKNHPAPFPVQLATRLIRMFSFVGDTVLDPFSGSGTTSVSAWKAGRNSINIEVDKKYMELSLKRFEKESFVHMNNHDYSYTVGSLAHEHKHQSL